MRQVFLGKDSLMIQKLSQPHLDDYAVLISVHYSFLSSSLEATTIFNAKLAILFDDIIHKVKSVFDSLYVNQKISNKDLQHLGFSCSGRVIAIGKMVKKFRPGDYVACAGGGWPQHADIVCVPEHLVVNVFDEKYLRLTSITTFGAIALQGLRRAQIQLSEFVAVLGLGLIGQLTVQLAKNAGCKVIAIDYKKDRLDLAKSLGADHVFDANSDDLEKDINFVTNYAGCDATIITASSSDNIVQNAMNITRKKGKVVVVSDVDLSFEKEPFYKKEIDLLVSCSYGPGRFDYKYEIESKDYPFAYVRWTENRNMESVVDFIKSGKINVEKLISQEFYIDDVLQAKNFLQSKLGLGVILKYSPFNDNKIIPAVKQEFTGNEMLYFSPILNPLKIGLVGFDKTSKNRSLKIIESINSVSFDKKALKKSSPDSGFEYGATKTIFDEAQIFNDNSLDALMIGSLSKYNSDDIIQSLMNRKALLIQKPFVTNFDQFKKLETFINHNAYVPLCLNFNRSFSPFIKKIKKESESRRSPMMVNYRINSNKSPIQTSGYNVDSSGKIILEASHIFDIFYFLIDSEPISVSVESVKSNQDNLFPTDNFSISISFSDGSVCSMFYTSLGYKNNSSERMELFFDEKTIIMKDYKILHGHGTSRFFDENLGVQNIGHELLIKSFFESISNDSYQMPISGKRILKIFELSLIVDQLVCQSGGHKNLLQ